MSEVLPISQLEDLATITMGQSPDSATVNSSGSGLPFLQGCAEFGARFPQPRLHCSPPLRVAKSGSTLISVRAPVGTTNRADQDYCIGRGLGAVLAKPGVADDVFLLHAIEANLEFLHRRSQGSTFLAIGSKELSSLPVPAPEFAVQRRIAEILSTLDEAIEQTEALIAKHQQIKAGLMHDLFTHGVTPDGHLRPTHEQAPDLYKESPLGWIPKEWEVKPLVELYASPIRDFGSFSSTNLISFLDDGVPFIKSEMIEAGSIAWDTVMYISEDVHRFLSKSHVHKGNILFSKIGSALGKAVVYDGSWGVCNSNAAIAKIDIDARKAGTFFVMYFLNHNIAQTQFKNMIVSLLPRINLGDISRLLVTVPGLLEQKVIEERLVATDSILLSEHERLKKMSSLKHGLMHDLLTGRVRVPASFGQEHAKAIG